jgi:hypothetical protein
MATNQEQFGFFGVSMTLVSWFVGFVIVAATALSRVPAADPGPIGRLMRVPTMRCRARRVVVPRAP